MSAEEEILCVFGARLGVFVAIALTTEAIIHPFGARCLIFTSN